jgi:(S)-mandelate dehydrogenase
MGNPDRNRSVAQLDGTPRRRHDVGGDRDRAIAVEDLRAIAHRRLPRFVLEYLEGGAGEEATLCVERSACADWRFTPRQLVDGASAASPPGSSAAPPRCLWWWRRPD